MSNKNSDAAPISPETIPDIIAEKRSLAKKIRDCANNGDYWDAKKAAEVVEDLEDESDRLETAYKRERGDAAKLREACEALVSEIGGYSADGLEVIWCGISGETIKMVRAALADAPPLPSAEHTNENTQEDGLTMADNETTADIFAEMRRSDRDEICPWWADGGSCDLCPLGRNGKNCSFSNYADRLEAAHKRELSKNASKNGADFGQLGDVAKLREALKMVCDAHYTKEVDGELYEGFEVEVDDGTGRPLICVVQNALSAPPRNCDVGTAKEQYKRHCAYCKKTKDFSCAPVMCRKCYADWAQMPYVEKEGGAK